MRTPIALPGRTCGIRYATLLVVSVLVLLLPAAQVQAGRILPQALGPDEWLTIRWSWFHIWESQRHERVFRANPITTDPAGDVTSATAVQLLLTATDPKKPARRR